MLTNLTASTEETQEAFETLVGAIKGLDLWHIATIVLLLLACMVVMKVLLRLLDRTFRRLEVEKSLHTFVRAALRVFLWIITICLVLGYIGIPMTSLIAVLSVLGLAITLAVQGSLSNLAGGIQVLVSKPFKADDYIEVGSVGGTVAEVGLVYTKLRTIDNKIISIPNGQISGEKIVNYSTEEKRRVDLTFNTSYDDGARARDRLHPGCDRRPPEGLFYAGALCAGLSLSGQQRGIYRAGLVCHGGLLGAVFRLAGAGQGRL